MHAHHIQTGLVPTTGWVRDTGRRCNGNNALGLRLVFQHRPCAHIIRNIAKHPSLNFPPIYFSFGHFCLLSVSFSQPHLRVVISGRFPRFGFPIPINHFVEIGHRLILEEDYEFYTNHCFLSFCFSGLDLPRDLSHYYYYYYHYYYLASSAF